MPRQKRTIFSQLLVVSHYYIASPQLIKNKTHGMAACLPAGCWLLQPESGARCIRLLRRPGSGSSRWPNSRFIKLSQQSSISCHGVLLMQHYSCSRLVWYWRRCRRGQLSLPLEKRRSSYAFAAERRTWKSLERLCSGYYTGMDMPLPLSGSDDRCCTCCEATSRRIVALAHLSRPASRATMHGFLLLIFMMMFTVFPGQEAEKKCSALSGGAKGSETKSSSSAHTSL